jgi:vacuolar protein sorting-associated protein 3
VTNLVRDYSPHLNTRSSARSWEWRRLRYWRRNSARAVDEVRLSLSFPIFLTHSSTSPGTIKSRRQNKPKRRQTYTLRTSSNTIVLLELEPVLKGIGQYNALCLLYKERGEDVKLLNAWSECVFFLSLHLESSTKVFVC